MKEITDLIPNSVYTVKLNYLTGLFWHNESQSSRDICQKFGKMGVYNTILHFGIRIGVGH